MFALLLENRRVLVVGSSESTETYDTSTEQWSLAGSLSGRLISPGGALMADGRVIILGRIQGDV